MSGLASRSVPAPGQAPLVAPNAAALLRRNAHEFGDRVAIKFGDRTWTHGEYYEESCRFASLFLERLPAGAPRHVAVLLDNTPDYLFAFGGAALIGAAVVGLNHTRRGEHLLRDALHTHCGPGAHRAPPRSAARADRRRAAADPHVDPLRRRGRSAVPHSAPRSTMRWPRTPARADPGLEPDVDAIWALIFTSGTSDAPKAVICSQRRLLVTGKRMTMIMDLGPDDVGYVCMPLFHSNAVQVGWAPSLVAPCAVGLGRRFSASRWLARRAALPRDVLQLHRQAARVSARATRAPTTPTTRCGSRSATRDRRSVVGELRAPVRRRGDRRVRRDRGRCGGEPRRLDMPPGALGHAPDHVQVVDDDGNEKARAVLDEHGRVLNADECVGEIVNTQGVGPFEGYYNNDDATAKTTRNGWYWSGDLGYKDAARLPLLRRPQRGLDPRRRRELPRRSDRGGAAERAGCRARGRVRRARRPGRRPGDGRPRARRGRRVRPGRVRVVARRAGRDRPEVAAALRARAARPADDGNEQDREAHARAAEVPARSRRAAIALFVRARGDAVVPRRSPRPTSTHCYASFVQYERERFWDL